MNKSTLFVMALLLTGSCIVPPTFDVKPKISLERLSFEPGKVRNDRGELYDTLVISVRFQDGDGDLGLTVDDTLPPFQRVNSDGTLNSNYRNIYPQLFVKRNGVYVDASGDNYFGRFTRILQPDEGASPLEGTITYRRTNLQGFFQLDPGDTIQAEVYILDRALHKSNVVRGPEEGYVIP